ncbi:hypothetical protein B0H15DRAFT_806125 [Mycena belliarum]|uniref:Uncharacterized protein n=1 Tax=Mycena belliarum TaxID=1033014 RepID=A0AAD6XJJ5_9AGAR|nr:hypothetical protein B0H15DRAFT_806125 [Mycena belliae]
MGKGTARNQVVIFFLNCHHVALPAAATLRPFLPLKAALLPTMDTSEAIIITTVTAPTELATARKLLSVYKRNNKDYRKKQDEAHHNEAYPALNPKTLAGSPNDPPALPNNPPVLSGVAGGPEQNNGAAAVNPVSDPPIDPSLEDGPPRKKSRGTGQTHRKIRNANEFLPPADSYHFPVVVDPMNTVKESITAPMLVKFTTAWLTHGSAVEAADGTTSADTFPSLRDSAIDIIDHVLDIADQSKFSLVQLKWTMEYESGELNLEHITALRDWLVNAELMIGDLQRKPVKKVKDKDVTVRIMHEGKRVTMTPAMLLDARMDPSKYPGCVEGGMAPVLAVLKNRCPVRGAALELWMIKMTAGLDGVPQRGEGKKSQLAFNPDLLKLVAAAIQAASGHDIGTLLQPQSARLRHTILWALEQLYEIWDEEGSQYADSFTLLAKKVNETFDAIEKED